KVIHQKRKISAWGGIDGLLQGGQNRKGERMRLTVTALVLGERQHPPLGVLFAKSNHVGTPLAGVEQECERKTRFGAYRVTLLELLDFLQSPSVEAFGAGLEICSLARWIEGRISFRDGPFEHLPHCFDSAIGGLRCR